MKFPSLKLLCSIHRLNCLLKIFLTFIEPLFFFSLSSPIPSFISSRIAWSAPSLPPLFLNLFLILTSMETSKHCPGNVKTKDSVDFCIVGDSTIVPEKFHLLIASYRQIILLHIPNHINFCNTFSLHVT